MDLQEPPPLDAELLEGLRDETVAAILRGSTRLPERAREIVLGMCESSRANTTPVGSACHGPVHNAGPRPMWSEKIRSLGAGRAIGLPMARPAPCRTTSVRRIQGRRIR